MRPPYRLRTCLTASESDTRSAANGVAGEDTATRTSAERSTDKAAALAQSNVRLVSRMAANLDTCAIFRCSGGLCNVTTTLLGPPVQPESSVDEWLHADADANSIARIFGCARGVGLTVEHIGDPVAFDTITLLILVARLAEAFDTRF